jgi:hypothetical protein
VTLLLCTILMPLLYFSFWLLIPGGRSAIIGVWSDLTSAFGHSGKGARTES